MSSSKTSEDNLNSFSFIDEDDIISNGDSISEYDTPFSRMNRIKRNTVPDHTESLTKNRELYFESLQFDAESDEEIQGSNKGRRKNKSNNRNGVGPNSGSKGRNNNDNDDNKEPPLDRLVKDIRAKVKDSKKFWSNLPYQICNNDEIAASPSNDMNCWNGNKIDR